MRATSSVASPSDTPPARLNEIVIDAICPECATLNGPVVISNVATSVSGICLPPGPGTKKCSSAVASSCALGTVSMTT